MRRFARFSQTQVMALPKSMLSGRQELAAFLPVETILDRHHQLRGVGSKADVAIAACAANMLRNRGLCLLQPCLLLIPTRAIDKKGR